MSQLLKCFLELSDRQRRRRYVNPVSNPPSLYTVVNEGFNLINFDSIDEKTGLY